MRQQLVNFAEKVVLKNYSTRTNTEKVVRRIVRHQAVSIDTEVFRKTDAQRAELKRLKRLHKKSTIEEREAFLGHFIKAKLPNWNLSFILTK